jgi:hypothetical protein
VERAQVNCLGMTDARGFYEIKGLRPVPASISVGAPDNGTVLANANIRLVPGDSVTCNLQVPIVSSRPLTIEVVDETVRGVAGVPVEVWGYAPGEDIELPLFRGTSGAGGECIARAILGTRLRVRVLGGQNSRASDWVEVPEGHETLRIQVTRLAKDPADD